MTAVTYEFKARIAVTTDPISLRIMRDVAIGRVADAQYIGWKSLEQSWQRDLDRLEDHMDRLGVPILGERRRSTCTIVRVKARD